MASRPIQTAEDLYDQEKFSDLTIKLSNGECIKVHKLVLCANNEYFDKLCGPESPFAERDQPVIELMEDDPKALKFVIRHLYGFSKVSFDNFPAIDESWRFWLALHTTADKYLEPDLSEQALKEFRTLARFQTDPNEVASIIRVVKTEMDHNGPLVDIATAMLKKHLGPLLEYEDFREWLGGEKNMMLDML